MYMCSKVHQNLLTFKKYKQRVTWQLYTYNLLHMHMLLFGDEGKGAFVLNSREVFSVL